MSHNPIRYDPGRQLHLMRKIDIASERMQNCAPGFGDQDDRTIDACLTEIEDYVAELRRIRTPKTGD